MDCIWITTVSLVIDVREGNLLYAIASAKAHYRHADAVIAGKAFDALLREYQSRQHGQRRYFISECGYADHHVLSL